METTATAETFPVTGGTCGRCNGTLYYSEARKIFCGTDGCIGPFLTREELFAVWPAFFSKKENTGGEGQDQAEGGAEGATPDAV